MERILHVFPISLSFFLSSCVDGDGTKESAGISECERERESNRRERESICVSNVCGGVNRYSKMSFYIYESVYVLVFYAPAISLFLSHFFRSLSLSWTTKRIAAITRLPIPLSHSTDLSLSLSPSENVFNSSSSLARDSLQKMFISYFQFQPKCSAEETSARSN